LSRESNVIYVGRKPPMNYVLGIITSFSGSNTKEVTLKARGQAITTAVDAAEITKHRFMKNLSIEAGRLVGGGVFATCVDILGSPLLQERQ